jgi:ATP-dependent DNA ligase
VPRFAPEHPRKTFDDPPTQAANVTAATTVVSQVFPTVERCRDLFDAAERLDLEGIVAKRKADPYRP